MPSAFVLINVQSGSEDEVFKQLKTMSEVKEAYVSYGVYDLIIKVQAEKLDELKTTITNKIRTLKNVSSTLSLITVEE